MMGIIAKRLTRPEQKKLQKLMFMGITSRLSKDSKEESQKLWIKAMGNINPQFIGQNWYPFTKKDLLTYNKTGSLPNWNKKITV